MQYVTWMMLHNLASQTGRIDVGIYFRRADVLVPQHGLDNTQVGTVFQQVGGTEGGVKTIERDKRRRSQ